MSQVDAAGRRPRRQHPRAILVVLIVSVSAFSLLQSLIIPVLPEIQRSFETDQSTVSWVLTAYLLSASISTPLLGRIGDRVGKKRILLVALSGLAVGSVLSAVAPSIGWLIAARIVQGVGGGVLPLSFGIIRDEFSIEKTRTAVSVVASIASIGFGAGIILAGPIVVFLDYHWLFWLPAIGVTLAVVGAALCIPRSDSTRGGSINPLPALLLSGALASLLLAISRGGEWGWTSGVVVALLIGGALLAAAWIVVEQRVRYPLIDMRMMRLRGVWTANAVAFMVGFSSFSFYAFLPQLIQTPAESGYGLGATITQSGWLLLPSSAVSVLIGLFSARLVRATSARAVMFTGSILCATAYLMVAAAHTQTWQLYLAVSVQGVGLGLVVSTLAAVVITSVPSGQTGVASGMNANIRTIGGAMGTAAFTGLVASHVTDAGFPAEAAYAVGFVMLAAAMLFAAIAALWIPHWDRSRSGTDALSDRVSVA
ncbi:MFS transporter [Williamsia muralis]|uniref:MFS transporter n=1 Tax=Williamsia marianensis TaxID=85044 RepID=UPI00166FEF73|nr:MFS transporter [Williamsia marianensis]